MKILIVLSLIPFFLIIVIILNRILNKSENTDEELVIKAVKSKKSFDKYYKSIPYKKKTEAGNLSIADNKNGDLSLHDSPDGKLSFPPENQK